MNKLVINVKAHVDYCAKLPGMLAYLEDTYADDQDKGKVLHNQHMRFRLPISKVTLSGESSHRLRDILRSQGVDVDFSSERADVTIGIAEKEMNRLLEAARRTAGLQNQTSQLYPPSQKDLPDEAPAFDEDGDGLSASCLNAQEALATESQKLGGDQTLLWIFDAVKSQMKKRRPNTEAVGALFAFFMLPVRRLILYEQCLTELYLLVKLAAEKGAPIPFDPQEDGQELRTLSRRSASTIGDRSDGSVLWTLQHMDKVKDSASVRQYGWLDCIMDPLRRHIPGINELMQESRVRTLKVTSRELEYLEDALENCPPWYVDKGSTDALKDRWEKILKEQQSPPREQAIQMYNQLTALARRRGAFGLLGMLWKACFVILDQACLSRFHQLFPMRQRLAVAFSLFFIISPPLVVVPMHFLHRMQTTSVLQGVVASTLISNFLLLSVAIVFFSVVQVMDRDRWSMPLDAEYHRTLRWRVEHSSSGPKEPWYRARVKWLGVNWMVPGVNWLSIFLVLWDSYSLSAYSFMPHMPWAQLWIIVPWLHIRFQLYLPDWFRLAMLDLGENKYFMEGMLVLAVLCVWLLLRNTSKSVQSLSTMQHIEDEDARGLKWQEVGQQKPNEGVELNHEKLAEAIKLKFESSSKIEFTEPEWKDLRIDSALVMEQTWIKAGDVYFKPAEDDVTRTFARMARTFVLGTGTGMACTGLLLLFFTFLLNCFPSGKESWADAVPVVLQAGLICGLSLALAGITGILAVRLSHCWRRLWALHILCSLVLLGGLLWAAAPWVGRLPRIAADLSSGPDWFEVNGAVAPLTVAMKWQWDRMWQRCTPSGEVPALRCQASEWHPFAKYLNEVCVSPYPCKTESCTDAALAVAANGLTCGWRMNWLQIHRGMRETAACKQIAGFEYPELCGACMPPSFEVDCIEAATLASTTGTPSASALTLCQCTSSFAAYSSVYVSGFQIGAVLLGVFLSLELVAAVWLFVRKVGRDTEQRREGEGLLLKHARKKGLDWLLKESFGPSLPIWRSATGLWCSKASRAGVPILLGAIATCSLFVCAMLAVAGGSLLLLRPVQALGALQVLGFVCVLVGPAVGLGILASLLAMRRRWPGGRAAFGMLTMLAIAFSLGSALVASVVTSELDAASRSDTAWTDNVSPLTWTAVAFIEAQWNQVMHACVPGEHDIPTLSCATGALQPFARWLNEACTTTDCEPEGCTVAGCMSGFNGDRDGTAHAQSFCQCTLAAARHAGPRLSVMAYVSSCAAVLPFLLLILLYVQRPAEAAVSGRRRSAAKVQETTTQPDKASQGRDDEGHLSGLYLAGFKANVAQAQVHRGPEPRHEEPPDREERDLVRSGVQIRSSSFAWVEKVHTTFFMLLAGPFSAGILRLMLSFLDCTYVPGPDTAGMTLPMLDSQHNVQCWTAQHSISTLIALTAFGVYFPFVILTPAEMLFPFAQDPQLDIRFAPSYLVIAHCWRFPLSCARAFFGDRHPEVVLLMSFIVCLNLLYMVWTKRDTDGNFTTCCVHEFNYFHVMTLTLSLWSCLMSIWTYALDDASDMRPVSGVWIGWLSIFLLWALVAWSKESVHSLMSRSMGWIEDAKWYRDQEAAQKERFQRSSDESDTRPKDHWLLARLHGFLLRPVALLLRWLGGACILFGGVWLVFFGVGVLASSDKELLSLSQDDIDLQTINQDLATVVEIATEMEGCGGCIWTLHHVCPGSAAIPGLQFASAQWHDDFECCCGASNIEATRRGSAFQSFAIGMVAIAMGWLVLSGRAFVLAVCVNALVVLLGLAAAAELASTAAVMHLVVVLLFVTTGAVGFVHLLWHVDCSWRATAAISQMLSSLRGPPLLPQGSVRSDGPENIAQTPRAGLRTGGTRRGHLAARMMQTMAFVLVLVATCALGLAVMTRVYSWDTEVQATRTSLEATHASPSTAVGWLWLLGVTAVFALLLAAMALTATKRRAHRRFIVVFGAIYCVTTLLALADSTVLFPYKGVWNKDGHASVLFELARAPFITVFLLCSPEPGDGQCVSSDAGLPKMGALLKQVYSSFRAWVFDACVSSDTVTKLESGSACMDSLGEQGGGPGTAAFCACHAAASHFSQDIAWTLAVAASLLASIAVATYYTSSASSKDQKRSIGRVKAGSERGAATRLATLGKARACPRWLQETVH